MAAYPIIRKAARITGRTLAFRNADVADAGFILSLRMDDNKSRHISRTPPDPERQRAWLQAYADSEDQAYFIILQQDEPVGTVRLYDPREDSFCWGSWILKDSCPAHAAIESALMVYACAIDHLGFTSAHFDVRKGNESVWKFHERFGAQRVGESELDYFYRLGHEAIMASRRRYARYLPEPVKVEWL